MLVEARDNLTCVGGEKLLEIADFLCHQSPIVRPIFECVKIFARLDESGKFTYARHPFDLGTNIIPAEDIASRMKDPIRRDVVFNALENIERECIHEWPFVAGSSSWVLLEVLHPEIKIAASSNRPAIIFRRAVRISPKGELTTTPLLERMFKAFTPCNESGPFRFVIDPIIQLSNISGTGVFTNFREQMEGMLYLAEGKKLSDVSGLHSFSIETANEFVDGLLESNFDIPLESNPGFYFNFEDTTYQVRSKSFSAKKKQEKSGEGPMPVFGLRR